MPEPGRGDQPTVNRDDAGSPPVAGPPAPPGGSSPAGGSPAPAGGSSPPAAGAPPGPPASNGHRPDGEDPTADVVGPRVSGSAAVPPGPPRRRKWLDDESEIPPPPPPPPAGVRRDPTLDLPLGERPDLSAAVPVDPWADADPLTPAFPPTRPYEAPPTFLAGAPPFAGPGAPPMGAPPMGGPPMGGPPSGAPPVGVPPAAPVVPQRPPKTPKPPKVRHRPAPPGWRPPPGYVAVPVRRRRKWPWVLLLSLLCCCGVPGYFAQPAWDQWPANASVPDEIDDLSRLTDRASQRTANALKATTSADHLFAPAFAAIYSDSNGKRITIFGTTGFHLTPEGDAANELQRVVEKYRLKEIRSVASDERGTYRRCGVGRDDGQSVVVCSWADHGSAGTGIFTRLSVEDSANLLVTLRDHIITRQN